MNDSEFPEVNPQRNEPPPSDRPLSDSVLRRIESLTSVDEEVKNVWMTIVQETRAAIDQNKGQILTGTAEQQRNVEHDIVGYLEQALGAQINARIEDTREELKKREFEYQRALAEENAYRHQEEQAKIQELAVRSEQERAAIDELARREAEAERMTREREEGLTAECSALRDELKETQRRLRDSEVENVEFLKERYLGEANAWKPPTAKFGEENAWEPEPPKVKFAEPVVSSSNRLENSFGFHLMQEEPLVFSFPAPTVAPDMLKQMRKLIPIFKGSRDATTVENFLQRLYKYFQHDRLSAQSPVTFAGMFCKDEAEIWFRAVRGRITTFEDFVNELRSHFKALDSEDRLREKLDNCVQGSRSAYEYSQEFIKIASNIPSLTEADKTYRYVRNLRSNVKNMIQVLRQNQDFATAMQAAIACDDVYRANASSTKFPTNNRPNFTKPASSSTYPKPPQQSSGATPSQARTGSGQNVNNGPVPMEIDAAAVRRKLTEEERQRCFKEGRCLYCREAGHLVADCPKKPVRTEANAVNVAEGPDNLIRL